MDKKQVVKKGSKVLDPSLGALKLPLITVGERRNFNLQPGVTEYRLWPFSTIEWITAENRYRARAIVEHNTTHDNVAFNSYHPEYSDAERVIAAISDSLRGVGARRVYNVFGEVIDVHTADHGGGTWWSTSSRCSRSSGRWTKHRRLERPTRPAFQGCAVSWKGLT
jgi:hypothetical protein